MIDRLTKLFFHQPDLSDGDELATKNRLDVYRLLFLGSVLGTVGGLCLSVSFVPEAAAQFIQAEVYFLVSLGALVFVNVNHLDKIRRTGTTDW